MKLIVLDTETTGLPPKMIGVTNRSNMHLWPHIIQLSYIIFDTELNEIEYVINEYINPDDSVKITEESTKIHGITKELLKKQGIPILDALTELYKYIMKSNANDVKLIGHNIGFDLNMIKIETMRCNMSDPFKYWKTITNDDIYCTMKESVHLCKIPYNNNNNKITEKYKYPTLVQLHVYLFNTLPINLHDAKLDIIITLRCYFMMIYKKDLILPETSQTFSKLFNVNILLNKRGRSTL